MGHKKVSALVYKICFSVYQLHQTLRCGEIIRLDKFLIFTCACKQILITYLTLINQLLTTSSGCRHYFTCFTIILVDSWCYNCWFVITKKY